MLALEYKRSPIIKQEARRPGICGCRQFLRGFMFLFMILLASANGLASGTPSAVQEALDTAKQLQRTYDSAKTMQADFRQETTIPLSNRRKQGNGTVVFKKPGKMRWDYLAPDRQVLISDGKLITIYLEKSRQMIVTAAREYLQSDVTYGFFSGTGDILRDFEVLASDLKTEDIDDTTLPPIKLVPRHPHPQVNHLYIWAAPVTFLIKRLQVIDHFDTVTNLYFDNIRLSDDLNVSDILFNFLPPEGTEIIEQ